jgi:hypothetical protein
MVEHHARIAEVDVELAHCKSQPGGQLVIVNRIQ